MVRPTPTLTSPGTSPSSRADTIPRCRRPRHVQRVLPSRGGGVAAARRPASTGGVAMYLVFQRGRQAACNTHRPRGRSSSSPAPSRHIIVHVRSRPLSNASGRGRVSFARRPTFAAARVACLSSPLLSSRVLHLGPPPSARVDVLVLPAAGKEGPASSSVPNHRRGHEGWDVSDLQHREAQGEHVLPDRG